MTMADSDETRHTFNPLRGRTYSHRALTALRRRHDTIEGILLEIGVDLRSGELVDEHLRIWFSSRSMSGVSRFLFYVANNYSVYHFFSFLCVAPHLRL